MGTKIYLIALFVMGSFIGNAANILPRPVSVKAGIGSFLLDGETAILAPGRFNKQKLQLLELLSAEFGLVPKKAGHRPRAMIILSYQRRLEAELGLEGYLLEVKKDTVLISSAGHAGIFYGIQSLRQLIERRPAGDLEIPCLQVRDRPRFPRRMFMLDEGRHFKGTEVVKGILDEMAILKMNTFHWHLTEDQGWRIEIKKYPLLTAVGGFRDSTENSGWGAERKTFKAERHGGFYTQDQVREIVSYAAERHIEVIPEIDMPGHSSAAIAAYPWLSANGQKIGVPGNWGVLPNAYNVADPKVREFLRGVLLEVLELFPSKIIHIGGDEVDYSSWKGSAAAMDFINERNLGSPAGLQLWFTNEMAGFLRSRGRKMMGWNDIMGEKLMDHFNRDSSDYRVTEKLAKDAVVHFWLGNDELIKKAILDGHQVVNAFHKNTYFNYGYDQISLKEAYQFEPVPAGLDQAQQQLVLGTSCQLWSEYVPEPSSLYHQLYPRIAASAEVGWTAKENKDYLAFGQSLAFFINRWKSLGYLNGQPTGTD